MLSPRRYPSRQGNRSRGGFRWQIALLFIIGAAVYYFANQEEVPFTGRSQMRTMTPEQEIQLGAQSYNAMLQQESGNVYAPNSEVTVFIDDMGDRLVQALQDLNPEADPGYNWTFNVIRSEQANAFALPGGYTAVYTGLFAIAEDETGNPENGLAIVMGHEIGHALAHHGAERMAIQNVTKIAQVGVALGAGGMDGGAAQGVMQAFGMGAQYGGLLPFSRKHESEADYIGLLLVARACYDPREAPKLWERMGQNSGGKAPPEIASTHPAPETRIRQFEEWMPEAIELYNQSCPTQIR